MAQPQWITKSGSLGTIPEGVFYQVPLSAVDPDGNPVYFELIAGHLPDGMQVQRNGVVAGIPKSAIDLQNVPVEVAIDTTAKFAVRAYTEMIIDGEPVVRLADRTFTLTIAGQELPEFITPAGSIGTYIDSTLVTDLKIEFTDPDFKDNVKLRIIKGQLPPGLTLFRDGSIKGLIQPLVGPEFATPGWDRTLNDEYLWQFEPYGESQNFQFTLEITDGKDSDIRTFSIFVYASSQFRADTNTTDYDEFGFPIPLSAAPFTADNTFLTADLVPTDIPVIINPQGNIGTTRADNFYAYKFMAIDPDGDPLRYVAVSIVDPEKPPVLPAGLRLDANTGWFYGYIPDQGTTEKTYQFAVRAYKASDPEMISDNYYYDFTIIGDVDTEVTWLTDSDLGIINNGAVSDLYVKAINIGDRPLSYRLLSGSDSQLPQGLQLLSSGHIAGKVSFNTFALDNGTTTFDMQTSRPTTFDMEFDFTVNAYNPQAEALRYQVARVEILNGGSGYSLVNVRFGDPTTLNGITAEGYVTIVDGSVSEVTITNPGAGYSTPPRVFFDFPLTGVRAEGTSVLDVDRVSEVIITNPGAGYSTPTVTIAPSPTFGEAGRATVDQITVAQGRLISVNVNNPGRGYIEPPPIIISGGGGTGASAIARLDEYGTGNAVSVYRRFKIRVVRAYTQPYENLYIKAMPSLEDRALISNLIFNQSIIPVEVVYRSDDPNFGVAKNVTYVHAYGITASTIDDYAESLGLNHYWKNLILGSIKTAQATDTDGNVIYEVVYSQIIDDQVNQQGQSVSKSVSLPYPARINDELVTTVYPNSLINMRDQVIDQIGQISSVLPAWMTSKQVDGRVLGFTPAWVIAYIKPGESGRVLYNIQQQFGNQLNKIDFRADRYELDRSLTHNWDPVTKEWIPYPAESTTFDLLPYYSLGFIATGSDYQINDTLRIPGSAVGGVDGVNDITLLVVSVNNFGAITSINYRGLVDPSVSVDTQFYNVSTTNMDGPGSGAMFNVVILQVDGKTIFDGGSVRFISPADQYNIGDSFDKYLLYPRINILGPVE